MYEKITYELLLERMLQRVLQEHPNVDTREGSIIYNALAPAAVELQNLYIQLDTVLDQTFADTAGGGYLRRRAAERGIQAMPATKAVLRGEFNREVPAGARFSLGELTYRVLERETDGSYRLECETAGEAGNGQLGTLLPIQYLDGLETARLTEVLIPGTDEEEEEHLRKRYFASLHAQAFGGNVTDYREKVNSLQGVGGCKVYPAWDGGGTVKVILIGSSFRRPTDTVLQTVQTQVDPEQNQGQGYGIAPIGHRVTVQGVEETVVNITAELTLETGWSWEDARPYAERAVDAYLGELCESWEESEELIVRVSQVESRLLSAAGVKDVAGTKLNGAAANLALDQDHIPVRGTING